MKESKKRRRKQPGKLMAKSCSQPVNLPGARPLMNPLTRTISSYYHLDGMLASNRVTHCIPFAGTYSHTRADHEKHWSEEKGVLLKNAIQQQPTARVEIQTNQSSSKTIKLPCLPLYFCQAQKDTMYLTN